jgi:hypothetical protein
LDTSQRALIIVAAATLLAACDTVNSMANGSNPITPEQSKTQVVDAATDVSRAMAEPVGSDTFSRSSCNDQGEAPSRGVVTNSYRPPTDPTAAATAFDQMTQRLESAGWAADSDFKTHATALKKHGVAAVLSPADASVALVLVTLYGECRDMTTTKAQAGVGEDITLG